MAFLTNGCRSVDVRHAEQVTQDVPSEPGLSPASLSTFALNDQHTVAPDLFDNEYYPGDACSILEKAPRGAYLSIGAERGFVGAALHKSDGIFLIDYAANVVFYNQVNVALLQMAEGRDDYLKLRLRSSQGELLVRAQRSSLPVEYRALFQSGYFDGWWMERVRQGAMALKFLQQDPAQPSVYVKKDLPMQQGNYLYDDAAFERLSSLAKNGLIATQQLDVAEPEMLERLARFLKFSGAALSVLDLSNAPERPMMLGWERTLGIVKSLTSRNPESTAAILVVTIASPGCYSADRLGDIEQWTYLGATFDSIGQRVTLSENAMRELHAALFA